MTAERDPRITPRSGGKDSASEAWPSEVSSFLGPKTSLLASLEHVKGLVGLARDLVCSKNARNRFAPPIPKPDIAVPSVARRLGDGGRNVAAGSIARNRKCGKNGRPKASGIDAAAQAAAGRAARPKPKRPPHQSAAPESHRHAAQRRPARVIPQRVIVDFFGCDRPGCEVWFIRTSHSPCQRFCSPSCRQALRRVLERERQWRRRFRQEGRQRRTDPCRGSMN